MTPIENAIIFATRAHEGQMRKDGITPYIVHPLGVAESVRRYGGTEAQYIAALLHDTIEDCEVLWGEINDAFGRAVADLVEELTNVYTKEAYPELNRAARKKLEDERIAGISDEAKLVKICDIAYNINDLSGLGGFKDRLLEEKSATIATIINSTSGELRELALNVQEQIVKLRKKR
jgi:GTP pyrophosphokinase